MEKVLLVDENDVLLEERDKEEAHQGKGILHRGFLVALYDLHDRILLAKRSEHKLLWPSYWDGSVAGHVYPGESYESAALRRVQEELGVVVENLDCPIPRGFTFEYLTTFQFQEQFSKNLAEREICALFRGRIGVGINPNPREISEYRFVDSEEAKRLESLTPWFKIALTYL